MPMSETSRFMCSSTWTWCIRGSLVGVSFFFNDTATTEIYTLSLHDALPISLADDRLEAFYDNPNALRDYYKTPLIDRKSGSAGMPRPISYAVFCLKKKNEQRVDVLRRGHVKAERTDHAVARRHEADRTAGGR